MVNTSVRKVYGPAAEAPGTPVLGNDMRGGDAPGGRSAGD